MSLPVFLLRLLPSSYPRSSDHLPSDGGPVPQHIDCLLTGPSLYFCYHRSYYSDTDRPLLCTSLDDPVYIPLAEPPAHPDYHLLLPSVYNRRKTSLRSDAQSSDSPSPQPVFPTGNCIQVHTPPHPRSGSVHTLSLLHYRHPHPRHGTHRLTAWDRQPGRTNPFFSYPVVLSPRRAAR